MFNSDPDRPIEEIVQDLHQAAQQHHIPGLAFISFSALLRRLSKQSIQSSSELRSSVDGLKAHMTLLDEKNGKLQRAVTALTIVSVLLALLQVVLAALPYVYPAPSNVTPLTPSQPVSSPSATKPPLKKHSVTPGAPTIPERKQAQPHPAAVPPL
jgi:hypothetical protein